MRRLWQLFSLLGGAAALLLCLPAHGFAASKKPKKAATATSSKGFGAKGPTFADVLAGFKTRVPENAADLPCPCRQGRGKAENDDDNNGNDNALLLYRDCCQPYHDGSKIAPTPRHVLQSRYAAFSYRIIPYIMLTTHPTCQYWQKDPIKWAQKLDKYGTMDTFDFLSLTVVDKSSDKKENDDDDDNDNENKAWIDFRVHVRSKQNGDETILKEKSIFLRQGNRWFYASGEARPEPVLKQQKMADAASDE